MRSFYASLIVGIVVSVRALAGPPDFAARQGLLFPEFFLTVADFDGDGIDDIIALIPNGGSYEVSVLLGTASGTFVQGPQAIPNLPYSPMAIAVADFNGDGLKDVAVLTFNQLFIGLQAEGTFSFASYPVPNILFIDDIAVADLNGDGLPDFAIPNQTGAFILLNQAGGAFGPAVTIDSAYTSSVVVADLIPGGYPDILLNGPSGLRVLLGNGRGAFKLAPAQPGFTIGDIFAVTDLNGDGKPDIAGTNGSDPVQIEVAYGNGDGTFGTPVELPPLTGYPYGGSVVAGDVNGDGLPDLVALASAADQVSMFVVLNQGNNEFSGAKAYPIQGLAAMVWLGAFTGGPLDALVVSPLLPDVSNPGAGLQSLLLNDGKGVFKDGFLQNRPKNPQYLISGDFNNDGLIDLIALNSSTGLTELLNTGKISKPFARKEPLPYYTGPLVAGDFNRDGNQDLIVFTEDQAHLLSGNGDGTFTASPKPIDIGSYPVSALAADMNGDGILDLVTSTPSVLLGNGDGTFQPALNSADSCFFNPYLNGIAVADFNQDGHLDLALVCEPTFGSEGSLNIFLGNGDGTLQTPVSRGSTSAFIAGDFNGDGIPDVAYFEDYIDGVVVQLGNGDGTFRTGSVPPVPVAGFLLAADLNGDGIQDLAVLDTPDAMAMVLEGNGDGTFGPLEYFGTATNPSCALAVNVRDKKVTGKPDLVFCSSAGVSIDLNTTR